MAMFAAVIFVLIILCNYQGMIALPRNASVIREELKPGMDIHVRPEEHTTVYITFVLTSLNKLDTVSQELSTTFVLYMTWSDLRLAWEPQTDEPEDLIFYVNEVWTPPLVVSNAIEDAIFLLKDDIVPLRVTHNGTVTWTPRLSPVTTCEIDISVFPVDTQICHINITSWIHAIAELDLKEAVTAGYTKAVNLDLYNDQAWNLYDAQVHSKNNSRGSGMDFKNLQYTLYFKRRERFYWVLLIIPFCCISFLMSLVFLIPTKYQESKVSYSVTLLLSFQLYLSLLQTLLPPVFNEGKSHVLGEYVAAVMIYGSVITSVLVIQLLIVYFMRRNHKFSTVTGTVSGTVPDTAFGICSGTMTGNLIEKKEATLKCNMAIKKGQSRENNFIGSADVKFIMFSSKVILSKIDIVAGNNVIVTNLNGILTAPRAMMGEFEGKVTGHVIDNEIKDGSIKGIIYRSKIWKMAEHPKMGFICNTVCFFLFLVAYVVALIIFLTHLKT